MNDNQPTRLPDALAWMNQRYVSLTPLPGQAKTEESVHLETIFTILMQLRDSRIALIGMCKLLLEIMDDPREDAGRIHVIGMVDKLLLEEASRE